MKITLDIPYTGSDVVDVHYQHLVDLVFKAHATSAENQSNISSVYFTNTMMMTNSFSAALSCAVLTLGTIHAPISQARTVFSEWGLNEVVFALSKGERIAGFGNSFHKTGIDPAWHEVHLYLAEYFPEQFNRLTYLTTLVNDARRFNTSTDINIFPNPAMFSAVVADIGGWKKGSELSMFVLARLPTWVSLGLQ